MDEHIKVSVIIPYFKNKKFIKETLESVLGQTYKNVEIIVVDDGSDDGLVEEYGDFFRKHGIIYVKKENGGPASARNVGMRLAVGSMIALLDADDVWHADKIRTQIDFHLRTKSQVVYAKSKVFMSDLGIESGLVPAVEYYYGDILKKLLVRNFITNSSIMFSRSVLDRCGFFREDPQLVAIEDYEYWLRVAAVFSIHIVLDPPLVFYRLHPDQISKKDSSESCRQLSGMFMNFFRSNELKNFRFLMLCRSIKYYIGFLKRRVERWFR